MSLGVQHGRKNICLTNNLTDPPNNLGLLKSQGFLHNSEKEKTQVMGERKYSLKNILPSSTRGAGRQMERKRDTSDIPDFMD